MADSTHSLLPPGYRFYPTEEELITFYLHNKLHGNRDDHLSRAIPLVPIYQFDPWQLPQVSGEMCREESEQWFFFTPRQEREARGGRPNRTTSSGYWKATGSPGYVYGNHNRVIGVKKTMVFYKGKAPTGRKTKWKMNEYKAIDHDQSSAVVVAAFSSSSSSLSNVASSSSSTPTPTPTPAPTPAPTPTPRLRHEFSLCRIYVKSGCSRAFDRRPISEVTISSSIDIQATTIHHIDGAANSTSSTAAPPPPPSVVITQDQNMHTSSPECPSSSGDDNVRHPSVLGEEAATQDSKMAIDHPPFWEWEQLNYWDM